MGQGAAPFPGETVSAYRHAFGVPNEPWQRDRKRPFGPIALLYLVVSHNCLGRMGPGALSRVSKRGDMFLELHGDDTSLSVFAQ